MTLAVLFSGGTDSCLALQRARAAAHHRVACLLTIVSRRADSWMFHTPAISWTRLQAEALGLPLLTRATEGEKETELDDLRALLAEAQARHGVTGVVTGALASVYQASRVQRVCAELGLWCYNPLWQYPQEALLRDLLADGYEVVVTGVAGEPLSAEWLGRRLDAEAVDELLALRDSHGLNPAGEGGELETLVTHGPGFRRRIIITQSRRHYHNWAGVLEIQEAELA